MKQNLGKQQSLKKSHAGFSLPELLTVIVIIGTLAAIAIPQYSDYLRKAKLTDGTATMADYRVKLEQYFQDNRHYGSVGLTCTDSGGGVTVPLPTSQYFSYACAPSASTAGAPSDGYVITATSNSGGGLGASGDYTYTLNQSNNRGTTKYKGTSVTKPCWLIGGSEC